MPVTRSNVFARPGDTFVTNYAPDVSQQAVTLCDDPERFYVGPLTIFGDIPTLLALADSLVAAAWTLKTAADAAAAPFTPADPEQAAEG